MNKELQNKAWLVLPKEFKEEVKKAWRNTDSNITKRTLEYFFGIHNLTSDAEGEEMLTVSRKQVQEMYTHYDAIRSDPDRPKDYIESIYEYADGVTIALDDLFGSKCLPDKTNMSEILTDSEPKPAEPKFKVGDKVRVINDDESGDHFFEGRVGHIIQVDARNHNIEYYFDFSGNRCWFKESDLEPYTEPKAGFLHADGELETSATTFTDTCQSQCKSQSSNLSQENANCDKQFDNILKDGFLKERRLNIAAMAMQGMLSNTTRFSSYEISDLVRISLNCADALIKKAKGGHDE